MRELARQVSCAILTWNHLSWCCALLLGVNGASAPPAYGWWNTGHAHITTGAVSHLPQPLRSFFEANVDTVSSISGQEPPGSHWIHLDAYPEFFEGTLSHDKEVLISLHGESFVEANGTAPWTAEAYFDTLSVLMASAATPQDWLDLLPVAGALAHYLEDLHNPLHLTYNYDGQYTGNNGIHSRYEGSMISRHFDDLTFNPVSAAFLSSVLDNTFDDAELHFEFLDDIIEADDLAIGIAGSYDETYYTSLWAETGAFTQGLFQEASEAVAASWHTAWVNAGSPTTFLEHSADFDFDGDVDSSDLDIWEIAYGTTDAGDADRDGDSDGADFLAWQLQYTGSLNLTASSSLVPEPASSLMFACAVLTLLAPTSRRVRRRVRRLDR